MTKSTVKPTKQNRGQLAKQTIKSTALKQKQGQQVSNNNYKQVKKN